MNQQQIPQQDVGQWLTQTVLAAYAEPGESILAVGTACYKEGDSDGLFAGIRDRQGQQVKVGGSYDNEANILIALTSLRVFLIPASVYATSTHVAGISAMRWQSVKGVAVPARMGDMSFVNLMVPNRYRAGELLAMKLQFWNRQERAPSQRHLYENGPAIAQERVAACAGLPAPPALYEVLSTTRLTDPPELEARLLAADAAAAAPAPPSKRAALVFGLIGLGLLLGGIGWIVNSVIGDLNALSYAIGGVMLLAGVALMLKGKSRIPKG